MRKGEEEKFRALLAGVYSFYGRDLSEFSLGVWWEALRQFDLTAVRTAFGRHARNPDTGQFVPRPADVVRMLGGRTLDAGQVAWTKVDHAVRRVGPYQSVVFDDPLIHRVLQDMGGWILFGDKRDDDWPFLAKEFVERYRGYAMRSEQPEYPPVLVGIMSATNVQIGAEVSPPMLIGDAEAAQSVMARGVTRPALTVAPLRTHTLQVPAGGDE
jgi:hypothetical protein